MTTTLIAPAARPLQAARPVKVTQLRVLASEWTKFRSLRSTVWTLLVGVTLMVGIGALIAAVSASQYHNFSASDRASFSAIGISFAGVSFAQLALGVLGVLLISGEYSTGMIRSSLTAVPRRLPVLWAKLAVFAGVVFAVSLAASVASFFLDQAILGGHHLNVSITAPGALRSVLGAAGYLTMAGMIGVAFGTLLRNTAAGISTFVGAFFVVPPLTMLLPNSISDHLTQYLPSNAGATMYDGTRQLTSALSPSVGFVVLAGYLVAVIAAAAWRLQRSDA
jgi:ABC-2 type transport system permease protein